MYSDLLPTVAIVVGLCSAVAYGASWMLTRRRVPRRQAARILVSGLLPTFVILAALIVGHIRWLAQHDGGYSPLAFLIYGFWLFALNMACNLFAAALPVRKR